MTGRLPPSEQAVWRAFLSVAGRTIEQIDQALQKQSDMTLTDYEILRSLAGSEEQRLRMSDLAAQVHVSRSRLTYRVDRLTGVGFVTREEVENDRRGLWAILTDKGGNALAEATPAHHADIRRVLFNPLEEHDLGPLEAILRSIAEQLDGEGDG